MDGDPWCVHVLEDGARTSQRYAVTNAQSGAPADAGYGTSGLGGLAGYGEPYDSYRGSCQSPQAWLKRSRVEVLPAWEENDGWRCEPAIEAAVRVASAARTTQRAARIALGGVWYALGGDAAARESIAARIQELPEDAACWRAAAALENSMPLRSWRPTPLEEDPPRCPHCDHHWHPEQCITCHQPRQPQRCSQCGWSEQTQRVESLWREEERQARESEEYMDWFGARTFLDDERWGRIPEPPETPFAGGPERYDPSGA